MYFTYAGLCNAQETYIDQLISRGELLVTHGQEALKKFRSENNYFSKTLEDELVILTSTVDQLKKEKPNMNSTDPVTQAFLHQAEEQVTRHANQIEEVITLGNKNGTDPTYKELLNLLDVLLNRAYSDVGYLVMHNLANEAKTIQDEVHKLEDLEKQLKSINYNNSPEKAQLVIEQLLQHERVIESEMFRIEQLRN